ncbi:ABC transporter ATP-binding protein [Haloechinothrix halophila]|uniref:ABC transporter ATP-binding protein n=1 Tax=Haloechinothrix halophila TaxID=1069073 RepID=UPI000686ED85|nr:ABC transporter ATP-binding protein [Haloechinothrix halophila]
MTTAHSPALIARGLRYDYGAFEALRGIDIDVHAGELFVLLGTNGAGKTTTLDVLEGRRQPGGGSLRTLGMDPWRQRRMVTARVGIVLQESALPQELTPLEFLQLWNRLTDAAATHVPADNNLARVGLAHRRDVRIGRLSGGERRKLELATALATDPELLILDEPTSGLDPETRADTWELLRDLLRRGTSILLTTHYLEEAATLADRLAIVHRGRVAVSGTLDEVLTAHRMTTLADVFHQVSTTSPEEASR